MNNTKNFATNVANFVTIFEYQRYDTINTARLGTIIQLNNTKSPSKCTAPQNIPLTK